MKTWSRNIIALCLLFAYSLSISTSVQSYLIDSVLKTENNRFFLSHISDSKTHEISVFPNLEPLGELINHNTFSFQTLNLDRHVSPFKHVESYTLTKDKQYLTKSEQIHPGLDKITLLFPFHTFS